VVITHSAQLPYQGTGGPRMRPENGRVECANISIGRTYKVRNGIRRCRKCRHGGARALSGDGRRNWLSRPRDQGKYAHFRAMWPMCSSDAREAEGKACCCRARQLSKPHSSTWFPTELPFTSPPFLSPLTCPHGRRKTDPPHRLVGGATCSYDRKELQRGGVETNFMGSQRNGRPGDSGVICTTVNE
jgi:hypothetical protein